MKRAMLIGSSAFSPDSGIEPLRFPLNDVEAMERLLRSDGFDFDVHKLVNVTNSEALNEIDHWISKAAYDDLVLIYFSGHGMLNRARELFLTCANTKKANLISTALKYAQVTELIREGSLQKVAIILDCCYAGHAIPGSRGDAGGVIEQGVIGAVEAAGSGIFFLGASGRNQTADEREEDGHGRFTKQVIKGLSSGDADVGNDGHISAKDLATYVKRCLRQEGANYEPIEGGAYQGELILGSNRRKQVKAALEKIRARIEERKPDFRKITFRKIEDYIDQIDVNNRLDALNDPLFAVLHKFAHHEANAEDVASAFWEPPKVESIDGASGVASRTPPDKSGQSPTSRHVRIFWRQIGSSVAAFTITATLIWVVWTGNVTSFLDTACRSIGLCAQSDQKPESAIPAPPSPSAPAPGPIASKDVHQEPSSAAPTSRPPSIPPPNPVTSKDAPQKPPATVPPPETSLIPSSVEVPARPVGDPERRAPQPESAPKPPTSDEQIYLLYGMRATEQPDSDLPAASFSDCARICARNPACKIVTYHEGLKYCNVYYRDVPLQSDGKYNAAKRSMSAPSKDTPQKPPATDDKKLSDLVKDVATNSPSPPNYEQPKHSTPIDLDTIPVGLHIFRLQRTGGDEWRARKTTDEMKAYLAENRDVKIIGFDDVLSDTRLRTFTLQGTNGDVWSARKTDEEMKVFLAGNPDVRKIDVQDTPFDRATFTLKVGMEGTGNQDHAAVLVSNIDECAKMCRRSITCSVFSHNVIDKYCYFYKTGKLLPNAAFDSGLRSMDMQAK